MGRENWGFIDFRLNLRGASWTLLHRLEREPSFAPWDEARGRYLVECDTQAFYNGRERGFALRFNHPDRTGHYLNVCFAEARSSDAIVVYSWESPAPSVNPPNGDTVPDDAWGRARHFNGVDEAALHIIDVAAAFLRAEHDAVRKLGELTARGA